MRRALFAAIILALALARPAQAQTPTPTPQPAINALLYACWGLNELAGARNDSGGANHLTDNNTVGHSVGVQQNAASFVAANSEYLSLAHNQYVSIVGLVEWTISVWIKPNRASATEYFVYKPGEYGLFRNPTNFIFNIPGAGSLTNPLVLTAGAWHHAVVYREGASTYFSANNNTPVSMGGGTPSGTNALSIGGAPNYYADASIDELTIWGRALSATERTWLYNGGLGRPCSQIVNPSSGVSPTPVNQRALALASGDTAYLYRAIDYGDIAVTTALAILIVVILVTVVFYAARSWFK